MHLAQTATTQPAQQQSARPPSPAAVPRLSAGLQTPRRRTLQQLHSTSGSHRPRRLAKWLSTALSAGLVSSPGLVRQFVSPLFLVIEYASCCCSPLPNMVLPPGAGALPDRRRRPSPAMCGGAVSRCWLPFDFLPRAYRYSRRLASPTTPTSAPAAIAASGIHSNDLSQVLGNRSSSLGYRRHRFGRSVNRTGRPDDTWVARSHHT